MNDIWVVGRGSLCNTIDALISAYERTPESAKMILQMDEDMMIAIEAAKKIQSEMYQRTDW